MSMYDKLLNKFRIVFGGVILFALWVLQKSAKPLRLQRLYKNTFRYLIRRTQLFDAQYYLEHNQDVSESSMAPISHYISYGDREGRMPMCFFEPKYYRTKLKAKKRYDNYLLHYYFVGRFLGLSPSPWFDVPLYYSKQALLRRKAVEPIRHFLSTPFDPNNLPTLNFDIQSYLRRHPNLEGTRTNLLVHYLRYKDVLTNPKETNSTSILDYSDFSNWLHFQPQDGLEPMIDVVVPIYRNTLLTLQCIYSVLASKNKCAYELVIINDDSPESDLLEFIKKLEYRGLLKIQHNRSNLGFVRSANMGMLLHRERDVVLLNSDTRVFNDWLDRLVFIAKQYNNIASITPLSNNATICSYPVSFHNNDFTELSYDKIDQLAAQANNGLLVDAPTAHGFCMYMNRNAINILGGFNEQLFGKGYGEENDWSQRAISRGFRNVIATNVFVYHYGGASFLEQSDGRISRALKILQRLYPNYNQDIHRFKLSDPLSLARKNIDWARLKSYKRNENVLIVTHRRGGGTHKFVRDQIQKFLDDGVNVYYLFPSRTDSSKVEFAHPCSISFPNLAGEFFSDTYRVSELCRSLKITKIISHGMVDFNKEAPANLVALAKDLDVPVIVYLHDFKVICPRINLVNHLGLYCAQPSDSECNLCLKNQEKCFEETDIRMWRERHYKKLIHATKVIAPSTDTKCRVLKHYPDIEIDVVPHERLDMMSEHLLWAGRARPNIKKRIIVIGAISKIKGFNVLLNCAKEVKERGYPIQFVVMGYTYNDLLLSKFGVEITGRYEDNHAWDLLKTLNPDMIWLPSVWPETYSYALSIALCSNLPIMGFEIGAFIERLKSYDVAHKLVSLDYANDAKYLVNEMLVLLNLQDQK